MNTSSRKMMKGIAVLAVTAAVAAPASLAAASASAAGSAAVQASPRCSINWGSLPEDVSTPVDASTVTNVRAGRHACYDRLVLDGASFARVRYVSEVREDGSGRVVKLRGGARLEIITNRSDGLDTAAPPYVPANPRELADVAGWQTFRQIAFAGDFEGQTTLGLGVRARLPFRLFVLPSRGQAPRVVIDVAHHW